VLDPNRRVNVEGAVRSGPTLEDIKKGETKYADVMTEEPGLTDFVTFNTDVGTCY